MIGRVLRSAVAWGFTIVFWLLFAAAHLLSLKRLPASWEAAAIRFWGRAGLWIFGIRLELIGRNTLEGRAARVMVVNHQSALDLCWGAAICAEAPLAIGKKEIVFVPVFNLIWWLLDFIRIDRGNHARAVAALEGVPGLIVRERRTLFVAPEGTRTRDGSILRFKKGAFHIARQAGVPVCPVVVTGAFELLPRGHLLPRRGLVRVSFLEPVPSAGIAHEAESAWIEDIRSKMIREYERIRVAGK